MTPGSAALLAGAGLLAGAVNAAAGGGSLLSFPALLAVGHSPLVANVTNTVGLLPGYVGGTVAYRRELAGQGARIRSYGLTVAVGAGLGVVLLLSTSEKAFQGVAPVLVLVACALLAAQPRLTAALRRRDGGQVRHRPVALHALLLLGGVYASYFGAAVGVMLLAVLGLLLPDGLQRLNGVKGALSLVATVIGATAYLVLAPVQLADAGVLAVGSLVGGRVGGSLARKVPDAVLRGFVLTVGVVVALVLLL
jgi:uncharacterized membrane protein YfcA